MDASAILALLGGISLLSAVVGGGIEVERIKIPSISPKLRIILGIIGVVLIGIAVWMSVLPAAAPATIESPTPTPVVAPPEPSPQSHPPEITNVVVREDASGGSLVIYQDVFFQDHDGDAYLIDWDLVSTTASNVTLSDSYIETSPEEQIAGTFHTAKWACDGSTYTATVRGTVFDRAGNRSDPVEYTLECRALATATPSPLPARQSFSDTYQQLADDGRYIKHTAFTADSGWVLLYDTSGVSSFGIPEDASDKLGELGDAGKEIKAVAFTSDSGWAILYDKNGAAWRGIPEDAAVKLGELGDAGEEIKTVAFTRDSGWVILYDRNKAVWRDIPPDAATRLEKLVDGEDEIKTIAFTGDAGWIILLGWADAWWHDIPPDAATELHDISDAGKEIKSIAFTSNSGWIILMDWSDAWRARTPP